MAIRYIPTEYKKPAMSALGYWAQSMQPMMQMWAQHKMQEDAQKKQFEMMQKARAEQQDKMDYSRLREGGWQTAEDLGYKGDNIPKPTVVKQGQGLYRPKLRKEALPDGGHAIFYGNKYITMTKSEDPKLTRGTPYVSNGHRKVPFYNAEGKKATEVDLGEVRVEENLTKQEKSDILLEQQKKLAAYKASLEKGKAATDTRTSRQKEYDRFKQTNPAYKGSIIDFNKAMKEKDPDQVALELAAKDWSVLAGKKSLADAAIGYRKAWSTLKGEQTTKLPTGLDEATIQFNMKKYNKSREEVIAKYKQMKGIR